MRRNALCSCVVVAILTLAAAGPAAAHEAPAAAHQPSTATAEAPAASEAPAAPEAPADGGFQSDVAADLARTGEKLVALAEAIPAEKYGWRPGDGVRSVSEVLIHLANANLLLPPGLGATPPADRALPQDMPAAMAWMREREATTTAKDDVVRELRQSLDYAVGAVRTVATPALEESIDFLGFPASRRAYVLILLTHNHEHLGQAIAYARSLGVTPPWSEPGAAAEAEEPSGY